MATIDERVVNMKFDASQFKTGVTMTMTLLDQLKTKFNFGSAKQSVDDLQGSVGRFNIGPMGAAISGIGEKFNAAGAVAFSVLDNIVTKAMNAGTSIVKSLTLDPVMDGFREYELNMNSIQTILANTKSKGSTLEDVNTSLGDLNTYSDETIYNFSEMTKSIGQFTAAGVDLDTSTASIKGFSNLAAISGSNAQQAAGGMYQMGQAISKGYMGLEDWNSMDTAGVGGEVFKEQLFETAKAMGKLSDVPMGQTFKEWEKESGSFRDSLSDKWVDADVLTNTLKGFGGDLDEAELKAIGYSDEMIAKTKELGEMGMSAAQDVKTFTQLMDTMKEGVGSGWAKTWELIIGDFEEAKALWTGVSNAFKPMIDASSDARNKVLSDWKSFGGRDALIEGISNSFNLLKGVLAPVGEAFKNVIPPITGQRLFELSARFADFTGKLSVSGSTADKIRRTFEGVFSVFAIAGKIIGGVVGVFARLVGASVGVGGGILSITATIGDFLVKVNEMLDDGSVLEGFFGGLGDILVMPIEALKGLGGLIASVFTAVDFAGIAGDFSGLAGGIAGFGAKVGEVFSRISSYLSEGIGKIQDFFSQFQTTMTDQVGGIDLMDILGFGALAGIGIVLRNILKDGIGIGLKDVSGIVDTFKETLEGATGTFEAITGVFDGLTDSLTLMQTEVKADILMKIAIAVGILAISIVALSVIDPASLLKAMVGIAAAMGLLLGAMEILGKVADTDGFHKVPVVAGAMILLSTAVLILSAAVTVLSKIPFGDLVKGLAGAGVAIGLLVAATHLMPDEKKLFATSAGLILVATALLIMAKAVEMFAAMSVGELAKGLIGMGAALAIIAGAMRIMPKDLMSTGAGLILVGAGLNIIAHAIKTVGDIPLENLVTGIGGIAAMLVGLALALKLMPGNLASTGAGLILVGIGLNVMAEALTVFASMSWDEIIRGLAAMAGAMGVLALGLMLMPKNLVAMGAGLSLVAVGISIMAGALSMMGGMSTEEIAKGLITLGASLLILAASLKMMSGSLAGAAALTVAAFALGMLAPVLVTLGSMSWQSILTGIGALAGVLAVLGIAAFALTPVIPSLFLLAGAIAAFAVASLVAGTAITLLASGLGMLAGPASEGINTLGQLISLFPLMLGKFAEGVVMFLGVLAANVGKIVAALALLAIQILSAALDVIVAMVPQLVSAFVTIVTAFLQAIITLTPIIIEAIVTLILAILEAIVAIAPAIAEAFTAIVMSMLNAIITIAPAIGEAITTLVLTLLDILATSVPAFAERGLQMLRGILDAIANNIGQVIDSATNIIVNFINGITNNLPRVIQAGVDLVIALINGIADGIRNNEGRLRSAAANLGSAIIEGLANAVRDGASAVITAITGVASNALNAAKDLLGIRSPSREFYKIGGWIVEGLVNGLDKNGKHAVDSAEALAGNVLGAFKTVDDVLRHGDFRGGPFSEDSKFVDFLFDIREGAEAANYELSNLEAAAKDIPGFFRMVNDVFSGGDYKGGPFSEDSKFVDFLFDIREGAEEAKYELSNLHASAKDIPGFFRMVNDVIAGGDYKGGPAAEDSKIVDTLFDIREFMNDDAPAMFKQAEQIGLNVTQGLTNGIKDNIGSVIQTTSAMAGSVIDEARKRLGIRSPSTEFYEVGEYVDEGWSNGIEDNGEGVISAAAFVAAELQSVIRDATTGGITDLNQLMGRLIQVRNEASLGVATGRMKGFDITDVTDSLNSISEATGAVSDGIGAVLDLFDAFDTLGKRLWASEDRRERELDSNGKKMGWSITGGVAEGIKDRLKDVEYSSENLVAKTVETTESGLGLDKRKNVFEEMGNNVGSSLSKGLRNWLGLNETASDKTTKRVLREVISDYKKAFDDITSSIGKVVGAIETFQKLGVMINASNFPAMFAGILQSFSGLAAGIGMSVPMLGAAVLGVIAVLGLIALWANAFGIDNLRKIGEDLVGGLVEGITSMFGAVFRAFEELLKPENLFNPLKWIEIGWNMVVGIAKGIGKAVGSVFGAIGDLVGGTIDLVKGLFGIKSPSRVFMGFGKYLDEGLAKGLADNADIPADAAESMGNNAIDALRKSFADMSHLIDGDIQLSPVVSPVLDLTGMRKDAKQIGGFLATKGIAVEQAIGQATNLAMLDLEARLREQEEAVAVATTGGAKIEFKQYNNSPKALSPIEIYRQTRNQLAMAERKLPS